MQNPAFEWANQNYPNASLHHKCAFANSVNYLVSGCTGAIGGPSLREHLCSWMLGHKPNLAPGEWNFEEAASFCAPLCFDSAINYRDLLLEIKSAETYFDDDPADIEELKIRRCLVCKNKLAPQAKRLYCSKHTNHDPNRVNQIQKIAERKRRDSARLLGRITFYLHAIQAGGKLNEDTEISHNIVIFARCPCKLQHFTYLINNQVSEYTDLLIAEIKKSKIIFQNLPEALSEEQQREFICAFTQTKIGFSRQN